MLKLWVYTCVHDSNNVIMGNEKQIICSGKVFQGTILVVSRKATIWIILYYLFGIDLACYHYQVIIGTLYISMVEFDVNSLLLKILGDCDYLPHHISSHAGAW